MLRRLAVRILCRRKLIGAQYDSIGLRESLEEPESTLDAAMGALREGRGERIHALPAWLLTVLSSPHPQGLTFTELKALLR